MIIMLSKQEKQDLVSSIPFWWHTIDFGDGIVSKGQTPMSIQKIRLSPIPKNLKNKTVLDVGCSNGFFSFECEKRGADVTAIDNRQHEKFIRSKYGKNVNLTDAFKVAQRILNSKVKFKEIDLYDLEKSNKKFDIVLFFGVLYHLKYPFKALEILYNLTKELLIIESHYIKTNSNKPIMRFYPGKELNNDPTCWWGPNIPCLIEMVKSAGFRKVIVFKKYHYNNDNRVILKAYNKSI